MMNKKHYRVYVYVQGQSGSEPFRRLYGTCETWAVSKSKAESNARYRNEGKAFLNEVHGQEDNWHGYEYEAVEI